MWTPCKNLKVIPFVWQQLMSNHRCLSVLCICSSTYKIITWSFSHKLLWQNHSKLTSLQPRKNIAAKITQFLFVSKPSKLALVSQRSDFYDRLQHHFGAVESTFWCPKSLSPKLEMECFHCIGHFFTTVKDKWDASEMFWGRGGKTVAFSVCKWNFNSCFDSVTFFFESLVINALVTFYPKHFHTLQIGTTFQSVIRIRMRKASIRFSSHWWWHSWGPGWVSHGTGVGDHGWGRPVVSSYIVDSEWTFFTLRWARCRDSGGQRCSKAGVWLCSGIYMTFVGPCDPII